MTIGSEIVICFDLKSHHRLKPVPMIADSIIRQQIHLQKSKIGVQYQFHETDYQQLIKEWRI